MRKLFFAVAAILIFSTLAYAEASFDQIQGLIKNQEYKAAIQGLTIIIQNHPKSAKAYYAMAQAQAGAGNQDKATLALDMAKGLDPELKFASSSNVENLQEALQPQTKKIEAIESHLFRNFMILLLLAGGGAGAFWYFRKRKAEVVLEAPGGPFFKTPERRPPYPERFEAPVSQEVRPAYQPRPSYVSQTPAPAPAHTTVVNNGGGHDLVTGMVLGSMLSSSHHDHRVVEEKHVVHERIVEREPEVSAWEDKSSSAKSSWEDSAPSVSSSWDSGSSSSSSWDSGSSSSSSWDSGSSSSTDSGSSSSSWD